MSAEVDRWIRWTTIGCIALLLTVHPVVLGEGERLFGGRSDKKPMRLLSTRTVGNGLAYLTYELVRDA